MGGNVVRYDEIIAIILELEGGFVNNPYDNGGPTNMGITHKVLASWRGVANVTPQDVKNLKAEEAAEIFKDRYWKKIGGKKLPAPLDMVMMDGAVNHGPTTVVIMLQKTLGVAEDGKVSETLFAAVDDASKTKGGAARLAMAIADLRKARYLGHEDAKHFIAGWRNRLNRVMAEALRGYPVSWTFKDGASETDAGPLEEAVPTTTVTRAVIDDEDMQSVLAAAGLYAGDIDGLFGPKSVEAMDQFFTRFEDTISGNWRVWPLARKKIAMGQMICREVGIDVGRVDGLFGQQTKFSFETFDARKKNVLDANWRDALEDLPAPGIVTSKTVWPTESDVPTFFGKLGKDCVLVPTKRLTLPFRMRLAWDTKTTIDGFRIHEKVYDSAARCFDKIYKHYGLSGIQDIGVDLYGGCSSCRKKKGGSGPSMHSWSIAIDFDPERNQLSWDHKRARLAKPDAVKFWEIWEAEGWLSLGRARDFDWMHVQAARL